MDWIGLKLLAFYPGVRVESCLHMKADSIGTCSVAGSSHMQPAGRRKPEVIARQAAEDARVAAADPLGCDEFFAREFVSLNRDGAASGLAQRLSHAARLAAGIVRPARVDALAALRDLGMMTAALVRAGAPQEDLSEARSALTRMGRMAAEVPRDTVYSYGPRNPAGPRERHFTDTSDERAFIESFRQGANTIGETIAALMPACQMTLDDPRLPAAIDLAAESLRRLVDTMIRVRTEVRPAVFTGEIRPFFEIIEVDGRAYVAPGGAQLPMLPVDLMVWADRIPQIQLYRYLRENVEYYPRQYRELVRFLEGRPSLLLRLESSRSAPTTVQVAKSLEALISQLTRFRHPHRKVTQDNMRLRTYGSYQTEVLDQLVENTNAAHARVKAVVDDATGSNRRRNSINQLTKGEHNGSTLHHRHGFQ